MLNLSTFKLIPGYDDYLINENGQIYSKKRNKLLGQCDNGQGYLIINLYTDGKPKTLKVHRLVAMTFLNNPDNLPCVNHKNGVKTDNRIENLEWCSYSQNNKHAYDHGLNETCRAAARRLGKITGKLNCKYAHEARKKHLDDNLKNLFDDIFIFNLKIKDIANKYNISCQYIGMIKSKQRLQTAISEYFGDTHEQQ